MTTHRRNVLGHYVRQFEKLVIIGAGTGIFAWFWYHAFNVSLRIPFENKGNLLMIAIYLVIQTVFLYVIGGLKIGVYKLKSVLLSQAIGFFVTNLIFFLLITLMVGDLYRMGFLVRETLFLCLLQIGAVILLTSFLELIFRGFNPPKQLMILYDETLPDMLTAKIRSRKDRYEIVGKLKVDDDWMEALGRRREEKWFTHVILYDIGSPRRNDILKFCYQYNLPVYLTPKISDVLIRSAMEEEIFDSPLLFVPEYGMTYGQSLIKRVFDVLISLILIILSSPVMLVTAICIKAEDGGPVFFRQERCTKGKKVFQILKFRSMVVDAEKDGKSRPAGEKDDRITKVGSFIRKTRIDEIPQFFNVLKGDMSLVGPRPERIEHVEKYSAEMPEFAYRLKVKGGLTGYAQVYGKYNTTAYDKLKMDLFYVQSYSIWLDIKLLLMTIKVLFQKESTEAFTEEAITKIRRDD